MGIQDWFQQNPVTSAIGTGLDWYNDNVVDTLAGNLLYQAAKNNVWGPLGNDVSRYRLIDAFENGGSQAAVENYRDNEGMLKSTALEFAADPLNLLLFLGLPNWAIKTGKVGGLVSRGGKVEKAAEIASNFRDPIGTALGFAVGKPVAYAWDKGKEALAGAKPFQLSPAAQMQARERNIGNAAVGLAQAGLSLDDVARAGMARDELAQSGPITEAMVNHAVDITRRQGRDPDPLLSVWRQYQEPLHATPTPQTVPNAPAELGLNAAFAAPAVGASWAADQDTDPMQGALGGAGLAALGAVAAVKHPRVASLNPKAHVQRAVQLFGTTTDPQQAGFVLSDGNMLNVAGGPVGWRKVEHTEISRAFPSVEKAGRSKEDLLNQFLAEGNARMTLDARSEIPELSVQLARPLTEQQKATVRSVLSRYRPISLALDIQQPETGEWLASRMMPEVRAYQLEPVLDNLYQQVAPRWAGVETPQRAALASIAPVAAGGAALVGGQTGDDSGPGFDPARAAAAGLLGLGMLRGPHTAQWLKDRLGTLSDKNVFGVGRSVEGGAPGRVPGKLVVSDSFGTEFRLPNGMDANAAGRIIDDAIRARGVTTGYDITGVRESGNTPAILLNMSKTNREAVRDVATDLADRFGVDAYIVQHSVGPEYKGYSPAYGVLEVQVNSGYRVDQLQTLLAQTADVIKGSGFRWFAVQNPTTGNVSFMVLTGLDKGSGRTLTRASAQAVQPRIDALKTGLRRVGDITLSPAGGNIEMVRPGLRAVGPASPHEATVTTGNQPNPAGGGEIPVVSPAAQTTPVSSASVPDNPASVTQTAEMAQTAPMQSLSPQGEAAKQAVTQALQADPDLAQAIKQAVGGVNGSTAGSGDVAGTVAGATGQPPTGGTGAGATGSVGGNGPDFAGQLTQQLLSALDPEGWSIPASARQTLRDFGPQFTRFYRQFSQDQAAARSAFEAAQLTPGSFKEGLPAMQQAATANPELQQHLNNLQQIEQRWPVDVLEVSPALGAMKKLDAIAAKRLGIKNPNVMDRLLSLWREQALISVVYHVNNLTDATGKNLLHGYEPMVDLGSNMWSAVKTWADGMRGLGSTEGLVDGPTVRALQAKWGAVDAQGRSVVPPEIRQSWAQYGFDDKNLLSTQWEKVGVGGTVGKAASRAAGFGIPATLSAGPVAGAFAAAYGAALPAMAQANKLLAASIEYTARSSVWLAEKQRAISQLLPTYTNELRAAGLGSVADQLQESKGLFSPKDVSGLIPDPALSKQFGQQWADILSQGDTAGVNMASHIHFDYGKETNADAWLRKVFAFHFWAVRNIPFYAQHLVENPGLAMALWRYNQLSADEIEEKGLTQRFAGMVSTKTLLPGNTLGEVLFGREGEVFTNPTLYLSIMGQLRPLKGGEDDPLGRQLMSAASNVGFSLAPPWAAIAQRSGLMGDSPAGNVFRASGPISAATGAIHGSPVDVEKPLKQALGGGFDFNQYYIQKRIAEMSVEQTGKPNDPTYTKAMTDPSSPIYQQAARQVARENAVSQGLAFAGQQLKFLPKTEANVRLASKQLMPYSDNGTLEEKERVSAIRQQQKLSHPIVDTYKIPNREATRSSGDTQQSQTFKAQEDLIWQQWQRATPEEKQRLWLNPDVRFVVQKKRFQGAGSLSPEQSSFRR